MLPTRAMGQQKGARQRQQRQGTPHHGDLLQDVGGLIDLALLLLQARELLGQPRALDLDKDLRPARMRRSNMRRKGMAQQANNVAGHGCHACSFSRRLSSPPCPL
jgi:hypothetical protein